MTRFIVLTLFDEMFDNFKNTSIIKRAIDKKLVDINTVDIRRFSLNKHKKVDFPPYGGGSGMIMSCEPIARAIDYSIELLKNNMKENNEDKDIKIIYLSPRGKLLNYKICKELSEKKCDYILLCGHYEGVDERIIEEYDIEEISIGDYVLTGGELASQVLMDSVIRLIPDVLSDGSLLEESHTNYLLEYPQYTKPECFRGKNVPEVLKSGNHKKIEEYRKSESIKITIKNRPDLYRKFKKESN